MELILLDDHPIFARSLQLALRTHGVKAKAVIKLTELYEALEVSVPDILLLDISMGKDNGLTIGEELLNKYPHLKVIFLSGYDLVEYHNKAKKMGAKGFLSKNIDVEEMLEKLRLVMMGESIFSSNHSDSDILTNREKEILRFIAKGITQKEVARELGISLRTVSNTIGMIYEKFDVNNSIEAIHRGMQLGIIDRPI
ncbi:MAG: response regulator transcription factor [Turicibacter sp.]|nr:response regulator transcription factor [Turicibacter sp.]